MKTAHILTRPSQHGHRDHAAQFERWAGYRLHPVARRIISILAQQRARRLPQRIMICDSPDHSPAVLRRTLADYLRWRATVVTPGATFFAAAQSRKMLDRLLPRPLLKLLPDRKWQPTLYTGRSPDSCRGLNFRMAMIVDADRFPRRRANFTRMLAAVLPIIGDGPDSLLIIHGTYRPRTRTEHFTARARHYRRRPREALWPVLDLSLPPPDNPDEDEGLVTITVRLWEGIANPRAPLPRFRYPKLPLPAPYCFAVSFPRESEEWQTFLEIVEIELSIA